MFVAYIYPLVTKERKYIIAVITSLLKIVKSNADELKIKRWGCYLADFETNHHASLYHLSGDTEKEAQLPCGIEPSIRNWISVLE